MIAGWLSGVKRQSRRRDEAGKAESSSAVQPQMTQMARSGMGDPQILRLGAEEESEERNSEPWRSWWFNLGLRYSDLTSGPARPTMNR